jgi:hypothetical protein
VVGCTTAGEILGASVSQESVAMTAIAFDHSSVAVSRVEVASIENSREAAEQLISALPKQDLTHVFLLSDGLPVNASQMVEGREPPCRGM